MSRTAAHTRFAKHVSGETRGLARDSLLLGIGKGATTVGMMAQIALIAHVLGLREYGVFALAVSFVALVDRFFDVDVGRAAIAFGAKYVASDLRKTAGIFQLSYLIDVMLGIAGFGVVAAAAPFAGPRLVGSQGFLLFFLYGLTLLCSTADQTSISLLQLLGRFGTIARLTILREIMRVVLIAGALFEFRSLVALMGALIIHGALSGGLGVALASRAFRSHSGGLRIRHPALAKVRGERRPMFSMIFQTNLISYGRLVQSQMPALVLGAFQGPFEVGVFKIGMAGAAAVGQLSTPAWSAAMPRLARLWNDGRVEAIRRLLAQASIISVLVMTLAGLVVILLREPILTAFGGEDAAAATTVFTLAVIGQVINGILFWNDSLLYASGRAMVVTQIYLPSVVIMFVLVLILGREWGANGAAVAVPITALLNNSGLTVAALYAIRRARSAAEVRASRVAAG